MNGILVATYGNFTYLGNGHVRVEGARVSRHEITNCSVKSPEIEHTLKRIRERDPRFLVSVVLVREDLTIETLHTIPPING